MLSTHPIPISRAFQQRSKLKSNHNASAANENAKAKGAPQPGQRAEPTLSNTVSFQPDQFYLGGDQAGLGSKQGDGARRQQARKQGHATPAASLAERDQTLPELAPHQSTQAGCNTTGKLGQLGQLYNLTPKLLHVRDQAPGAVNLLLDSYGTHVLSSISLGSSSVDSARNACARAAAYLDSLPSDTEQPERSRRRKTKSSKQQSLAAHAAIMAGKRAANLTTAPDGQSQFEVVLTEPAPRRGTLAGGQAARLVDASWEAPAADPTNAEHP